MSANGRLPRAELGEITRAVNGERCFMRADAARAFNAMNALSERRFGVTLRASSARSAYRLLRDQQHFWAGSPSNPNRTWNGNLAALPGTSNHGWGLAIDLATMQMRRIVDAIGAAFGWAKKWSDAPTEWWHLRFRPGRYSAVTKALDPLRGYRADEIRWIRAYDKRPDQKTRAALRRRMQKRADEIRAAAKKGGWSIARRHDRYRSLAARTK